MSPRQLEALTDRFLAAHGCADLAVLTNDALAEFDMPARSLRRRQRGSRVIRGGRPGAGPQSKPLTANVPGTGRYAEQEDAEQEGEFQQDQELAAAAAEHCQAESDARRELLDDFSALLDTHRVAARDRCTPRMAQIAASRQRIALAMHGDLLGFDDFHALHAALYALPRARRDRASRRVRMREAPRQADLFGGQP